MDLTEITNKLNEMMDSNQKLQIGLDVINIRLEDLETRVNRQPNENNQRNKSRFERVTISEETTILRMSIKMMISQKGQGKYHS